MKKFGGLLFCIAIFASAAFFLTREASISDIQSFDEVDFGTLGSPEALVLFDVDKTLIQPEGSLTEPSIIEKIALLKERKITVLAITAMNTGEHSPYESMEKWRYEHLKELGFEGDYPDQNFDIQGFKKHPVFYKGIIATDGEAKGPVLSIVLDRFSLKPSEIMMFDDRLSFLESVRAECDRRHIPFHGYHYHGARKLMESSD